MYVPEAFCEECVPVLHEAMRKIAFATLVTFGDGGLTASHIPLLIDSAPAPFGTLAGHLARSNPQWHTADPAIDALAIFAGPHRYITLSWYPTKRKSGKVVPTWNYVAIHAYGRLRMIEDPALIRAHVTRLTATHEAGRAEPWAVSDAPAAYIDSMVQAIVGIEMTITRLEGKWKVSQNRPPEDRDGVAQGLSAEGAHDIAALVTSRRKTGRD